MRARDLRKLIGTDTLVDVMERMSIGCPRVVGGKIVGLSKSGEPIVNGIGSTYEYLGAREWQARPRDIRLHTPAKKSPEVGSAEQPKPAPAFKVGDRVDCDWNDAGYRCVGGTVEKLEKIGDKEYCVKGDWEHRHSGVVARGWFTWCKGTELRHHVAKEEEKVAPHVVPITANIRDAIEAMKRVKTMAEIEIGRLEALIK